MKSRVPEHFLLSLANFQRSRNALGQGRFGDIGRITASRRESGMPIWPGNEEPLPIKEHI